MCPVDKSALSDGQILAEATLIAARNGASFSIVRNLMKSTRVADFCTAPKKTDLLKFPNVLFSVFQNSGDSADDIE